MDRANGGGHSKVIYELKRLTGLTIRRMDIVFSVGCIILRAACRMDGHHISTRCEFYKRLTRMKGGRLKGRAVKGHVG